jgi:hypothetical protein
MTTTQTDIQPLDAAVDRLLVDARDARAAVAVLDGSNEEAAQRYSDQVAEVLANMQRDLRLARSSLAARQASTAEDIRRAMDDVTDAATAWIEEMNVRANLARMEMRDRAESTSHRMDRATAEVKRAVERVGESVQGDLSDARRVAIHAVRGVRDALTDAAAGLRDVAAGDE